MLFQLQGKQQIKFNFQSLSHFMTRQKCSKQIVVILSYCNMYAMEWPLLGNVQAL
jgi:hypothetical protein